MKHWPRAVVTAVVVALAIAATPLSATAVRDKSEPGTQAVSRHLTNYNSDRCLAVPGGSRQPGIGLIQWGCGTWADHYWELRPSYGGRYYIVNRNSNQCLALPNGTHQAGAQVIQWPCDARFADHLWYFWSET